MLSNTNVKAYRSHLFTRMMAIALSAGTLCAFTSTSALAQYKPPENLGLPRRREPAGTRGSCSGATAAAHAASVAQSTLTSLMPQDSHFGQTLSPYPTFYWYVPPIEAQAAEFVLLDEDDEVYTVKFYLEPIQEGGLIRLSLPENAGLSPLEVDKDYHWYFSLICNEFDRGADIFTEGWVRYVNSDALSDLEDLPDFPQPAHANEYAQAGIWFDALEIVAEARRQNALDSSEWQLLLDSVGLSDFTDAPFLQ
ncbi:MAG: DUF928 domain-containing protein [Cyanobacteria bacterium P01_F01_bin.150]